MKKILGSICLCASLWAGEWVMFSDGTDTYLYSTTTGEVYIRYHLKKRNYEDVFVKMPRGMFPNEVNKTQRDTSIPSPTAPNADQLKEMQNNALKKSQEILNSALD
ncbi:MAG: hypothetical protein J1E28_06130 [Helicobacter sp.]|uniref:hypothetical protein n=1 Tax=Helicobacter sp. TaxID=218 RepID=UPI0025C53E4C|nr:hypothetical protein [Helicobacter sp.]MCH5313949.1 hypothetical protein [Helicobacter sp.]